MAAGGGEKGFFSFLFFFFFSIDRTSQLNLRNHHWAIVVVKLSLDRLEPLSFSLSLFLSLSLSLSVLSTSVNFFRLTGPYRYWPRDVAREIYEMLIPGIVKNGLLSGNTILFPLEDGLRL